jgi:hypothetical protein
MPLEFYQIWIRSGLLLYVSFTQHRGQVISFAVLLVAELEDGLVNIARYDTAHGLPHRDVLGRKKGLLTKHWFPNVPYGRVLDLAISDFKANHESYIRIFEEN